MQENAPLPSSKNDADSTVTSQLSATEQAVDTYSAYRILEQAGNALRKADPKLDISLPVPLPKLPQLLASVQSTVLSSAVASTLSVWVPHKLSAKARAKLRKDAQDVRALCFQDIDTNPPKTALPIYTSQTLTSADHPTRLTSEQRNKLKAKFQDVLASNRDMPDPHGFLPVSIAEQSLPLVKSNVLITAIDDDDNMPEMQLTDIDCLWDTGSHLTIISEDILGADFCGFLHGDPINEPYVLTVEKAGGVVTKVQVSAVIEMSNKLIKLNTIALVVPLQGIPNQRSGIILGQRGLINSIQYTSIPRNIMIAEGRDPGENYWGIFNVDKYMDVDDMLVHV